jgi:hypothetical protein
MFAFKAHPGGPKSNLRQHYKAMLPYNSQSLDGPVDLEGGHDEHASDDGLVEDFAVQLVQRGGRRRALGSLRTQLLELFDLDLTEL